MKVIFASLPNKKTVKIMIWLLALIIVLLILYLIKSTESNITKEEVFQAIYNTQQAKNYRWQIKSQIRFKEVLNILSDIEGEKNNNAIHIKGDFVKTPIDIYQISNMTYRSDPLTKSWLVIKNNIVAHEEVITTELNPVAPLNFASIMTFSLIKIEQYAEKKSYRIEISPKMDVPFLADYWSNFKYIIWVDKNKKYLNGYELTAQSKKDNTGSVKMDVRFMDYGEVKTIRAPL